MVDLACSPTNFIFFFDIPLFYCYTNLDYSIIYCISSGDMQFFLATSISPSECDILEFSAEDFSETLVILSALLLPITSPVASPVASFELLFLKQFLSHLL